MTPAAKTTRKTAKKAAGKKAAKATKAKASGKKATGKKAASKKAAGKAKASKGKAKAKAKAAPKKAAATKKSPAKAASKATKAKASPKKAAGTKTAGKAAAKESAKTVSAPSPAKRTRKRAPKTIYAELLEKADRLFGPLVLPECESVLEQAVYLVLRETGTELTTQKAMKALKEEFVDWNEVRVSRASELARLMSGTTKVPGIRRYHERSNRMRELIDQIYGERNEPSLEFLLDEKPKGQLEVLEDFDDLGMHNAFALVQWLSGKSDLVLVSTEMVQAAQALGLLESAAVSKAKKPLSALVSDLAGAVTLQAHLNQLGHMEQDEWPTAIKEMLP